VLILDLDRHEELDATLVLLLVAGDEGRLLAGRVDGAGRLRAGSRLGSTLVAGGGCLWSAIILIALLELGALNGMRLVGDFALFIDVGVVSSRLNICSCKRFLVTSL